MARCSVCRKLLKENPHEFFNYEGRCDYKVIDAVGILSYRCSCYRCGHIWITRTNDAKFQYEQPKKYQQQRNQLERYIARMDERKRNGNTLIRGFPKSIVSK